MAAVTPPNPDPDVASTSNREAARKLGQVAKGFGAKQVSPAAPGSGARVSGSKQSGGARLKGGS